MKLHIKSNIKKYKNIEIAVLMAFALTMVISVTGFDAKCKQIEGSVLRMHVIANSDDECDQQLKLKVRDAILYEGKDIFNGSTDAKEAQKKIEMNKDRLLKTAQKVIKEEGYDYDVKVEIGQEYFSTRSYDNITMPAGQYNAVRVIIGEGKGHNWWCVMFPPLCVPGACKDSEIDAILDDGESEVVRGDPEIDARFKIVEFFEGLSDKTKNK